MPRAAWAPHVARRLFAGSPPRHVHSIVSTIDLDLQRFAKEILQEQLVQLGAQNVHDGAILVADNAAGDVLAHVGNGGAYSSGSYVDAVKARRQAGSTLKPFLYGLAFDKKLLTAASLLDDTPIDIVTGRGTYRPGNYDHSFHGIVTARTALASSLNVPAVRTLLVVKEEPFVGLLQQLGFQGTRGAHDYGPSLALGSADVTLWELVNAYRSLARGGMWSPLRLRMDEVPQEKEKRVLNHATAYLTADILADRESRSVAFGFENPLATRFWSAVKTGTSKDMRDNWCIGFSERYTVGVWVGNFSGAPMWGVSGISGAALIWTRLMNQLHQNVPSLPPPLPAGLVRAEVTIKPLGLRRSELFLAGIQSPVIESATHRAFTRIDYPVQGMVVGLDPDIPRDRQRIFFEAKAGTTKTFWSLNGKILGSASTPFAWPPQSGRHVLALLDGAKQTLDTVEFFVKPSSLAVSGFR